MGRMVENESGAADNPRKWKRPRRGNGAFRLCGLLWGLRGYLRDVFVAACVLDICCEFCSYVAAIMLLALLWKNVMGEGHFK